MCVEILLTQAVLRPWRPGDEASLVKHANNRNIWRNVRDLFPYPYTPQHAREWVHRAGRVHPRTNFAIAVDGDAVGGIGIVLREDIYRRSAEIGYWLGEEFWGRGIVTEAVKAMSDWGFAHFDICRIYAGVFEWNPASMRVLEKAGYTLEARLAKQVTKDGETIDEFIYAIVR